MTKITDSTLDIPKVSGKPGKTPSVFIKTYGCQMNERDSEAVAAQLQEKGYEIAPTEQVADIILLNTCSVRDAAEQKAIGKMQNLIVKTRKKRPNVLLGFMGCMAQSRGQELVDQLPGLDLVVGTQKFHRVGDHLDVLLKNQAEQTEQVPQKKPNKFKRQQICDTEEEAGSESSIREHLINKGQGVQQSVTAFVSIMQGCNQYCSFCIVPYTRGKERSRSIEDIVSEVRGLVDQGIREVTLLGQIVTSYGKREIGVKNGLSAFTQLIEATHEVEGLDRIRFTSPHPKGYQDDLIEAYGRLPKLCESAHLPLQSGSDSMLKKMKRGYTTARYLEIIGKLRAVRPNIGITTDIIVGYPGESEEEFQDTIDLCREVEFDNAYVFKYSPRKGTPAAEAPDPLPQSLIEERHTILLSEINKIARRKYEQFLGQEVEALVEGPSRRNSDRMMGRTRCNKIVVFEANERFRGQLLKMKVESVGAFTLYGNPAILNLD